MGNFDFADANKEKIAKLRPFSGHMLEQIRDFYRIGITWSSNAIEGNTLTESETKILIEDGLTIGGKPLRDTFEALGLSEAYDFMFTLLNRKHIDENAALTFHKMFYSKIDDKNAGVYRKLPVIITGSNYPVCQPEKIRDEMKKLFIWANEKRANYHPIEFAAKLHKNFVFIHPFIDGNGRMARLLMNTALIQDGYLPVIIPPIQRLEYINYLEKAHSDDTDFVNFICEKEIESQIDFSRLIGLDLYSDELKMSNSTKNQINDYDCEI